MTPKSLGEILLEEEQYFQIPLAPFSKGELKYLPKGITHSKVLYLEAPPPPMERAIKFGIWSVEVRAKHLKIFREIPDYRCQE